MTNWNTGVAVVGFYVKFRSDVVTLFIPIWKDFEFHWSRHKTCDSLQILPSYAA